MNEEQLTQRLAKGVREIAPCGFFPDPLGSVDGFAHLGVEVFFGLFESECPLKLRLVFDFSAKTAAHLFHGNFRCTRAPI